ncbi:hypothetical protein FRC11_012890 [Ceratobasidium sp. 423]|nr:hypothetical protein FRC11_012890 [Ceratobasidium sp. 423]
MEIVERTTSPCLNFIPYPRRSIQAPALNNCSTKVGSNKVKTKFNPSKRPRPQKEAEKHSEAKSQDGNANPPSGSGRTQKQARPIDPEEYSIDHITAKTSELGLKPGDPIPRTTYTGISSSKRQVSSSAEYQRQSKRAKESVEGAEDECATMSSDQSKDYIYVSD